MSIVVKSVSKLYGTQRALDGVEFSVNSGEITGFIGPNGAGKSTMMKIITGYIEQTEGDVLVNGKNTRVAMLEIKKEIGYLPESNPLYPEMYVAEYLGFIAGLHQLGKNKTQRVNEVIEQTGLTPERNKKIMQLSKGYKQRVGIAQAIIHDPSVLILDEPTSGLDPNQIIEIRNLISLLGKNKTIMLSTHLMQEVEAICHKVIIINKGKLVADGHKDKLIESLNKENARLTVIAEFSHPVSENELLSIEGILGIKKINETTWLFESINTQDIRNSIFHFAVKKNITVLSMQKKEKSLEEVFQEFTR